MLFDIRFLLVTDGWSTLTACDLKHLSEKSRVQCGIVKAKKADRQGVQLELLAWRRICACLAHPAEHITVGSGCCSCMPGCCVQAVRAGLTCLAELLRPRKAHSTQRPAHMPDGHRVMRSEEKP